VSEHRDSESGRSSERSGDGYRFPRTYLRPGYTPADVDALIKRIKATLAGTAPPGQAVTADEVRRVQFGTTRFFRHGYDEESVDNALDAYIERLPKR
jgi:DivIVA domain-containing protein